MVFHALRSLHMTLIKTYVVHRYVNQTTVDKVISNYGYAC